MGCLYKHTHTYANILREGCFCLNFLSLAHYDGLMATIRENDLDADEFCVGGFDLEQGKRVRAPAIEQSFMNMECSLHDVRDLSGANVTAMVIGRVEYVAVEERYALEAERRFGREGSCCSRPGRKTSPRRAHAHLNRPNAGRAPRLIQGKTGRRTQPRASTARVGKLHLDRPAKFRQRGFDLQAILPALKKIVSKSAAVLCAIVRNGFFQPMGEQPPCT